MCKKLIKKIIGFKNEIGAIISVVILYFCLYLFGIGCPIKYVTGISCVGCGMTRAWISVLRLDFQRAFYYHPAFLVPLIALVIYMIRARINKKVYIFIMTLLVLILIGVYAYRMICQCDRIVVCNVKDGFIYRAIIAIQNLVTA